MNQAKPRAESIDDFVFRLTGPLERTLDALSLSEFRNNSLFHLDCLVDEFRSSGNPEDVSVAMAIEAFGPADKAAMAMLDEWCRGRKQSAFCRSSASAVWWSFACFGIASGLSLLASEVATLWSNPFLQEPVARFLSLIAPILAGIAVGYCVPTGNLRALGLAALPLTCHAIAANILFSPFNNGPAFPVQFVVWWAPVGALALVGTAWLRRHRPLYHPAFPSKEILQ